MTTKKFKNDPRVPPPSIKDNLSPDQQAAYQGKSMEELVSIMTEENKVDVAAALIRQIQAGDAAAFKIVSSIMEKQGFNNEREIPISDERFGEIIKIMAEELRD